MTSYAVYYLYEEGDKEFVESFTDSHDAHDEKRKLQAEIDADEDSAGVRVTVVEEL